MSSPSPLWIPSPEAVARANMTRFIGAAGEATGGRVRDYASLYRWSIEQPEEFWPLVWKFCGVIAERREDGNEWLNVLVGKDRMAPPDPVLGPRWFERAHLNFAENLLRFDDDREALVSWNENGLRSRVTYRELNERARAFAAALGSAGVKAGDRVAGFMPNIPETVIAMLGAASIGAVWSSCSPDFGVGGVLDRFGQIEPRVLVTVDGYRYNNKRLDLRDRVRQIVEKIPSIEQVVVVPYVEETADVGAIPRVVLWNDFLRPHAGAAPVFARLPFDHPLYIMYSSGTTGLPKCMVHGAGGTLLQHLKELVLHCDLTRDDRIFYFTTCGWMMWNWLVSSLAVGATVVLYDGAPFLPARQILWDMAQDERVTVFGTSAKWLALAEKTGYRPAESHDLSALKSILSTGSPLAPPSFDYVYRDVKKDVRLSSISGGTDIVSCFALGNPIGPVWRGELQTLGLGMKVEVFDEDARSVTDLAGELVCTMPFPSMPTKFWNDPDGSKYRAAYFEVYPNVWRHGDWSKLTEHGGLVIYGRSDATLNPGGVRIGTAEIYRQVEQLPEIVESIVVGQDVPNGEPGDVRIVLFVKLAEGVALTPALRSRIHDQIRANTSPHHVPKKIIAVTDIPRTISGKITELAVREVIHGRPVNNIDALANPEALALFRDLKELAV
ncbi:MAG TPA: acetoacetate--CoA ligase [Gemmatimonadaceae bacterium]|nr:acetoacetate--CoA ligase [Gemmatimonadaceae bacterium]